MLRRSRVRIDFVHFAREDRGPDVQFVFQFDANERSFTVRDVWGRIFENKYKLFSFTTGMFARPFGYEINLSSSDRESPERGRMSQTIMKSERDLGAMVTLDARKDNHPLKYLKVDMGIFNGQGINAAGDFDNTKDFIGRVSLKPKNLNKTVRLSGGISMLYGGLENNTKYRYSTGVDGGLKKQMIDSALTNVGTVSPRKYYGGDLQLRIAHKVGFTELRGDTETPLALLTGNEGFYNRHFDGAYFYLLQNIFSVKHQLLIKYDWYDPNTKVSSKEIGAAGADFTAADIKFKTLGIGYINYVTPNVKAVLYYAMPVNEQTQLQGFTSDVSDRVLTCRLQFRF
jgi:phosphate-selective porin